ASVLCHLQWAENGKAHRRAKLPRSESTYKQGFLPLVYRRKPNLDRRGRPFVATAAAGGRGEAGGNVMRTPLVFALALVVAGIASATATAEPHTTTTTVTATNGWQWTVISYPAATPGYRFITDTLGGDGHGRTGTPRGITVVTDTRGGDGHPVRP